MMRGRSVLLNCRSLIRGYDDDRYFYYPIAKEFFSDEGSIFSRVGLFISRFNSRLMDPFISAINTGILIGTT